jgi:hypothetical protein
MEFEAALADARNSIGVEAFNEAWKAGWATPLDSAVDQALDRPEASPG